MNSGSKVGASSCIPGSRDRMLLDDVIRYRLITNDWVHTRYLPDLKLNAVVKITGRLCREGWLSPHKLFQRRQYFTAGNRLVRQRGLPVGRVRSLGPQSLTIHYAALRYCMVRAAGTPELNVALPKELSKAFPWVPRSFLDRPQVLLQLPDALHWRLLRIDMGGRPDHISRKIVHDLQVLTEHKEFMSLLSQGQFTQVVLCPSQMKKRLIEQSLSERVWPKGVKFQIGFIPDLFQLLAIS